MRTAILSTRQKHCRHCIALQAGCKQAIYISGSDAALDTSSSPAPQGTQEMTLFVEINHYENEDR